MSIMEELKAELVAAMKAGDTARRDAIRQAQTEIVTRAAADGGNRDNISDDIAQAAISGYVKKMAKALEEYRSLGERGAEQAAKLEAEVEYLSRWLPKTADENTTRQIVRDAIAELGVEGDQKAAGRVIGAIMKNRQGLDGALVARLVAEELAGN